MGAFIDTETGELRGSAQNVHWRSEDVSAALFAEICAQAGLRCISQELVNLGTDFPSDAFSAFVRSGSSRPPENLVVENLDFMDEAVHLTALAPLYFRPADFGERRLDVRETLARQQGELDELRAEMAMMRATRVWRAGVRYWGARARLQAALRCFR